MRLTIQFDLWTLSCYLLICEQMNNNDSRDGIKNWYVLHILSYMQMYFFSSSFTNWLFAILMLFCRIRMQHTARAISSYI